MFINILFVFEMIFVRNQNSWGVHPSLHPPPTTMLENDL